MCISESCIKIKINLNFCFHTSLKIYVNFFSSSRIGAGTVSDVFRGYRKTPVTQNGLKINVFKSIFHFVKSFRQTQGKIFFLWNILFLNISAPMWLTWLLLLCYSTPSTRARFLPRTKTKWAKTELKMRKNISYVNQQSFKRLF